ncbi:unnamed protein product [Durusdinium trenchii]|uniref:Uncharacterized protein n=1 Tax=Durusdinium trenchii TaxID=1381693 RepID=A0ABP0LP67_9DINO
MLAAFSLEESDLKLTFVALDESGCAVSLSDHLMGTELESDRRSAETKFPLSCLEPHEEIKIHKSCATREEDQEALLQLIICKGERPPSLPRSPKQCQAYEEANTLLRMKIEAAAMRVAVLVEDRKTQDLLLGRANDELRAALKKSREDIEMPGFGIPDRNVPEPRGKPPEVSLSQVSELQATELSEFWTGSDCKSSKQLGAGLEYLMNEFPVQARRAAREDNPTFHQLSEPLAKGETGLGYNRTCPRDGRLHCSIVDALSARDAKRASLFLSWCWGYRLQMYLDTWKEWRQRNPDSEAFVWQCFFCNNQYRLEEAKQAKNGGKVADESLGDIFQGRLLEIGQMVVMLDNFDQPKYLERIWCVYDAGQFLMSRDARIRCSKLCKPRVPRMFTKEMYTAALHPGKVKVEIILPPDQAARIKRKLKGREWEEIKSKLKEASLAELQLRVGFKKVNEKVRKTMMDWIGQQMTSILGEDCEDEVEAFEVERERAEKSKRLGVRLRYLLKVFPGQAQHVSNQENPTFHELGNSLACGPSGLGYNRYCPRDGKLHCSIVDALSLDDAQKASHYLSWCWDYCLQMYLDSWAQWQLQNPDDEAFVWQDFFCNNQYRLLEAFHLQHQEADRLLQDRLLGIGQMVVNVVNAKASKPEDEEMVKAHIREDGGFDKVNGKVRSTLMDWIQQQLLSFLDEQPEATDFLRTAGLSVDRLEAQGIQTLEAVGDRLLQAKLHKWGLAPHLFEGRSEEEVRRDRRIEESLPTQEDKKKFRHLRQEILAGEAVVEELVALEMLVSRGSDWCYDADSDDDLTPEDGGPQGVGRVVAWHSRSGEKVGAIQIPRSGWVKVQWQVTGYTRSYRMGTSEYALAELVFAAIPDQEEKTLKEVPKGEIQLHHLRCSFGYKCGTRWAHYALFDNRPEACEKVAALKPGDVVEDRDGDRSVCIGLKYNADKKKVDLWFHCEGRDGAGLFTHADHNVSLRRVSHKRVQEANRKEVEGASDGEIDHDEREWVGQNLKPTLRYLSKSGQVLHFDVRDEMVRKFKMPYKSGDVLVDKADGEKMTCIGVASDPMRKLATQHGRRRGRRVTGSVAELWFHVETSDGAGLSPKMHKALSRFRVLRNEPVVEMLGAASSRDSWDAETAVGLLQSLQGSLQCDYCFPRGAGEHSTPDWFDVREDLVENVVGFKPGTVLNIRGTPPGTRLTLIGFRTDPDNGEVGVWWHHEESCPQVAASTEHHPTAFLF